MLHFNRVGSLIVPFFLVAVLALILTPVTAAQGLRLFAISENSDKFFEIFDPLSGVLTGPQVTITLAGFTVSGCTGVAVQPGTGTVFALVRVITGITETHRLVTIDPATGIATDIGLVDNGSGLLFADITFTSGGTLFGVTDDDFSASPATLFTINTTTAVPTLVTALGNSGGSDGEAIAFNPGDGLIYHLSGVDPNKVLETIDPAAPLNPPVSVPLSVEANFGSQKPFNLAFWGNGLFLATEAGALWVVSTTGQIVPTGHFFGLSEVFIIGTPPDCTAAGQICGATHIGDSANPDLSVFYSIDQATGAAAMVGPTGFLNVSGIDFNAAGTLFGTGLRMDGSNTPVLITIDPATGAGTEIGTTGLSGGATDISFRPSDGTLFGLADVAPLSLATWNTTTAAGTAIAPITGTTPLLGNAFAFDASDTAFYLNQNELDTLNTTTGAATVLGPTSYSFPLDNNPFVTAMDFDPTSGVLFGTAFDFDGDAQLVTIDTATGIVTNVGATQVGLQAIAISPTGVCSGAPSGIISWWPGEGNAQDIVSHFDGALQNGATFGTGTVGQAFSLDGIDDAILVDNNAALNPASITVEAWVNPNSVPAGTIGPVVTKWGFDATIDSYYLALLGSGGVVTVLGAIGDGATGDSGFSGGIVTLNTWNHIAMTYDAASGQNRLYLNGVSVGQRVRANGIFPTTSRVFIGREDSSNNRFFSGLIDEPTIYGRALTDAEILAIFNAGGNGKCGASPTGEADLTVTKTDSPDPVLVNTNITYTVTVTNNGPDGATSVTLTDTIDAATSFVSALASQGAACDASALPTITCALGNLANAASATVTIVVTAPASAGTVTNNASVTANEADANLANNAASASTTVNTVQADVAITKTDSPDPQGVGGNITYTVVVANAGPDPATNVMLTDTLGGAATSLVSVSSTGNPCNGFPAITCTMGTINAGASETVTIVVTANAAGTVTNTASTTATEPDPNTANNTNIAQNTTVQAAGFTLTVTPASITILPGHVATFTVTITPTPFVATVDLTGTGAPPLGSLSFASTTLNVGNVVTSTSMNVSSTGFFATQHSQPEQSVPTYAYWLPMTSFGVAGVLLMGCDRKRLRGNQRNWLAALLSLIILASLIVGCAFGRDREDEGTPFGTYPITVTATGGGVTQTATVNVVVQGTN